MNERVAVSQVNSLPLTHLGHVARVTKPQSDQAVTLDPTATAQISIFVANEHDARAR